MYKWVPTFDQMVYVFFFALMIYPIVSCGLGDGSSLLMEFVYFGIAFAIFTVFAMMGVGI